MAKTINQQISGMMPSDDAPIAVGVTGHRPGRLAGVDTGALAARLVDAFAALEAAAPGGRFRLVGSLAEGADTIAVDAALARSWQIDTVLPFARGIYADDFDDAATAALTARLAASANVFELPGAHDEAGGAAAAYERAGRVVLAQSDLLLAIWDGDPARGRGGTTQIVLEAVALSIPVLVVHPGGDAPELLWSGLNAHDFGPEAIETVARGTIGDLPRLMEKLVSAAPGAAAAAAARRATRPRPLLALAYPALLAAAGVRALRLADVLPPRRAAQSVPDAPPATLDQRIAQHLTPTFDAADHAASAAAQLFRGAFVSNFALAAVAVILSLLGLVAPTWVKPILVLGEFAAIARILMVTRAAGKAGWHRHWLDRRQLAEQLRCLAVSARLGDLLLRGGAVDSGKPAPREARQASRAIGLPSARVDAAYLADTRDRLIALLDDQAAYLTREAGRMHRLEHRLHRLGGALFALTAIVCVGVLTAEMLGTLWPHGIGQLTHHLPVAITLVSAALPAIGAALYGIRMQGDFAGVVERNHALSAQLGQLRRIAADEDAGFDNLRRLIARTAQLLTADVAQWRRASQARPLALPG